jgi:hypothetical protein
MSRSSSSPLRTGKEGCRFDFVPGNNGCFIFPGHRRQRMEVRADDFGNRVPQDKGSYARALAKLFQANQLPAVMPRKRMAHPHLYDRRLVAGVSPDVPRPEHPAQWGT